MMPPCNLESHLSYAIECQLPLQNNRHPRQKAHDGFRTLFLSNLWRVILRFDNLLRDGRAG